MALCDRSLRDGGGASAARRRIREPGRHTRSRRSQGLGSHRAACPARILAAAVVCAAGRRRRRTRSAWMKRSSRGFTLIELLVVVAILAIISVMALVGLDKIIDNQAA